MPDNVKNTTVFTRQKEWFSLDGAYPRESIDTSEIEDIKEGTVILFPYYLDHYVKPLKDDVERITIAFLILCRLTTVFLALHSAGSLRDQA